jgi:hypothetical protein
MSNKIKRFVTDPTTGEQTFITTQNKSGRVEWTVSKEWQDDKDRAKRISARKRQHLNQLRRAIA